LRGRELARWNWLCADEINLMQQLIERAIGGRCAYLHGADPIAESTHPPQRSVRVVGPALLLAQHAEQPGICPPAEHLDEHFERIVQRVGWRNRRVPDEHVRLRGPRAMDQ